MEEGETCLKYRWDDHWMRTFGLERTLGGVENRWQ